MLLQILIMLPETRINHTQMPIDHSRLLLTLLLLDLGEHFGHIGSNLGVALVVLSLLSELFSFVVGSMFECLELSVVASIGLVEFVKGLTNLLIDLVEI